MDRHEVVAGIDVAKTHIDLCIGLDGKVARFKTTAKDLEAMADCVRNAGVTLVVMESTGPYSAPVAEALWRAEVAVAIVNALRCRQFAESIGQLEKTDKLDAQMLVAFGLATRPRPSVPLCKDRQRLRALHARREQLVAMRAQDRQRLEFVTDPMVRRSIKSLTALCDRHIKKVEAEMGEALKQAAAPVRELARCVQSFSGISLVTATALLGRLPELGQLNHREIAKLVGVAPLCNDSGKKTGVRRVRAGRRDVRRLLYMPTLSAMRYNPQIRALNERLKANGKPGKVRVVACMRKLLTILNAMARDCVTWDPTAFQNPALETAA